MARSTKPIKKTSPKAKSDLQTSAKVSRSKSSVTKSKTAKQSVAKVVKPVEKSTRSNLSGSSSFLSRLTPKFSREGMTSLRKDKRMYGLMGVVILGLVLLLGAKFLVVAWVDRQPITRFEYYQYLDQKYGKDLREQLIVQKLVTSEAGKRGITVTPDEVNKEIQTIETSQGGADKLDQVLQAQNINQNEFHNLVKLQLLKQKMFSNGVNITDDEVTKFMEDNKSQLPDTTDASPSAIIKLKDDVREQLKQQKTNQNFNDWLNQQLQGSRVNRV